LTMTLKGKLSFPLTTSDKVTVDSISTLILTYAIQTKSLFHAKSNIDWYTLIYNFMPFFCLRGL
jgi:hypothetical protein